MSDYYQLLIHEFKLRKAENVLIPPQYLFLSETRKAVKICQY